METVGSPLPQIILPSSPLPEGAYFRLLKIEVSPTKWGGERQVLGKSSSDEPSTILCASTTGAQAGMSVSETPIECVSVHQSPQTHKPSEREQSDTLTEQVSEKPKSPERINLDNFVTKEEYECEIFKRDQEIVSLKPRL